MAANGHHFIKKIPKEIFPTEGGGEDGCIAEHWGMTEMI
jgi:hypothetical protein